MKCIKELSTDSITRVNDERAQFLVKKGTHVYVPKKFWKGFRDPEPVKPWDNLSNDDKANLDLTVKTKAKERHFLEKHEHYRGPFPGVKNKRDKK